MVVGVRANTGADADWPIIPSLSISTLQSKASSYALRTKYCIYRPVHGLRGVLAVRASAVEIPRVSYSFLGGTVSAMRPTRSEQEASQDVQYKCNGLEILDSDN